MPTLTRQQTTASRWLLNRSEGQPEDQIRKHIGDLLTSLGDDIYPEFSYRTSSGPADIYLPRRRTIVETKALGLADDPEKPQSGTSESPRQQLERYLHAEIRYELNSLPLDDQADAPWTGIVTDGRVWHVWRYPHEEEAAGTPLDLNARPSTPDALLQRLSSYVLSNSPVGKLWLPADPRSAFEPFLRQLENLHSSLPKTAQVPTATKKALWLEMLRTSSMEPANEAARERLFVAHSFLVALARAVVEVLAKPREVPDAEAILRDGFVAWIVDTVGGRQWARDFMHEVHSYEWRRRPGDVLRPLYEEFVDERDRKAFGEFYTPDWLAEMLVAQVCDEEWCENAIGRALLALRNAEELEGVGVLDPTCGSGTFLYHAATRLVDSPVLQDHADQQKSAVVASLVHGIDVHPVAAEIARATLLRALPVEPPNGKAALCIYEGDALLIHEDDEDSIFRRQLGDVRIRTPKGLEVCLPNSFVEHPNFADDLRRLLLAAGDGRPLPADIASAVDSDERVALSQCHEQFTEIIATEGNSVWAWYIRNTAGPYRLSERKVDRIVANPPWVTMADVQAESRKRHLEQFAASESIALWMGGKQAPHFDIAQLFVKRSRLLYLANPETDPAAWLVKKSALSAGSWAAFRDWHRAIIAQTLDLVSLRPFGGGDARRCCVLFEGRSSTLHRRRRKKITADIDGRKPLPADTLDDVASRVSFFPVPTPIPRQASDYRYDDGTPMFRQGASVTPKVLAVVDRFTERGNRSQRFVRTARSKHDPWSRIKPQEGTVPAEWVQPLLTSKEILPFAVAPSGGSYALVPIEAKRSLAHAPERQSAFWRALDDIYKENKGEGRHTPATLLSRLDYGAELSAQIHLIGRARTLVLYPASGDLMRACRVRPGTAVVDFTLYRLVTHSAAEAAYLVALLNAPSLMSAYAQSRSSGRDFHQHPWRRIPIPRYDGKNEDHVALARLGSKAENIAKRWLTDPNNNAEHLKQVGLSNRLRETLAESDVLPGIDEIVSRLLPKQARSP